MHNRPRRTVAMHLEAREPDFAEMAERYGAETLRPRLAGRLECSGCGSRQVDMVVSGTERR